jgi:hypothetical protein
LAGKTSVKEANTAPAALKVMINYQKINVRNHLNAQPFRKEIHGLPCFPASWPAISMARAHGSGEYAPESLFCQKLTRPQFPEILFFSAGFPRVCRNVISIRGLEFARIMLSLLFDNFTLDSKGACCLVLKSRITGKGVWACRA